MSWSLYWGVYGCNKIYKPKRKLVPRLFWNLGDATRVSWVCYFWPRAYLAIAVYFDLVNRVLVETMAIL